jgi:hypothetical protein
VALVPIQFLLSRPAPYSTRRAEFDQRFEQGAGYLDAASLGVNGVVVPFLGTITTPPIWTPGWATFTIFFDVVGSSLVDNVFVILEHLDPFSQAVVYGSALAPAIYVATDTTVITNFGSGATFDVLPGGPTAPAKYLLWHLVVFNMDVPGVTASIELLANSRVTI